MTQPPRVQLDAFGDHAPLADDPPSVTLEHAPAVPLLPAAPDSRSPQTYVIAEETCVKVLTQCYGWAVPSPGTLVRRRR